MLLITTALAHQALMLASDTPSRMQAKFGCISHPNAAYHLASMAIKTEAACSMFHVSESFPVWERWSMKC